MIERQRFLFTTTQAPLPILVAQVKPFLASMCSFYAGFMYSSIVVMLPCPFFVSLNPRWLITIALKGLCLLLVLSFSVFRIVHPSFVFPFFSSGLSPDNVFNMPLAFILLALIHMIFAPFISGFIKASLTLILIAAWLRFVLIEFIKRLAFTAFGASFSFHVIPLNGASPTRERLSRTHRRAGLACNGI